MLLLLLSNSGSSPNVTVSISGVSATAAVGSLVAAVGVSLSGVAGVGSVGNVSESISVAITGNSATGAVGNVSASTSGGPVNVSITGVSATASVGNVVSGVSYGATGVSATGSVGAVKSALNVPLTGVSASGSAGSVSTLGGVTLTRQEGLRKTRYVPGRVPDRADDLPRFLQAEFERLNDGLESPFTHQVLEKLSVEPGRKPSGKALIAYADGTNWNPGSGEGVYAYYGGSWKKLG